MNKRVAAVLKTIKIFLGICSLVVVGWGAYKVAIFLRTAPQFDVGKLSVSGLKRVAESEVLSKAGFELGTNIFRADLKEIRERVEELDWVRHAQVERVLPDQIMIKVSEREPIGLTRIRGEIYQFDGDARILDPDTAAALSVPILDGMRSADPGGNLRKVEIYQRVIEELGEPSLSEIHITDSGDVSVVSASDPLLVNLGVGEFHTRWNKYLQLKPQIQQQYPQAVRVDLRFKNQVIIKMMNDEKAEQVVWAGKKNTL